MFKKKYFFTFFCFIGISLGLFADYPAIKELNSKDVIFKQFEENVALYYSTNATGKKIPDLVLYSYIVTQKTDIFSIAARLNIPYDTIATLNRLNYLSPIPLNKKLILPTIPGVFVSNTPETDLEVLINHTRKPRLMEAQSLKIQLNGKVESFLFFPSDRFSPTERGFFFNTLFRFPLPKGTITSGFGYRPNPFSGQGEIHKGIDLAAPIGTEVFSTRDGIITEIAYNVIYGKYIKIKHDDNWESLYGHLKDIVVQLNQKVKSGTVIGTVGITGNTTGPHLHFELRNEGESKDPALLLGKSSYLSINRYKYLNL